MDWAIGTVDIASMVSQISSVLPNSYTVSLKSTIFYDSQYNFSLSGKGLKAEVVRGLVGPILLGKLMNHVKGFIYVAAGGYLIDLVDQRASEFRFLKSRGLKIATYWCGSEIRSPKLMKEMEDQTGLPNIFTYIGQMSRTYTSEKHELRLKRRAEVANRFADVMFDLPTDQRSYLEGHREPFFIFMEDEKFISDGKKFENLDQLVVVHAPSNPIIKGTQLVRAAVAKLKHEGYDFEYLELIRFTNEQVLSSLRRAHIVLNQFYGFNTSVFGAEAMASNCALLSSVDETIETTLAPGVNNVAVVTKHWQVYENLRHLLDHPDQIEPLAKASQKWARKFASVKQTGPLLKGILDSVLDGSYSKAERANLSNEQIWGIASKEKLKDSF